jgi:hypothetical protein
MYGSDGIFLPISPGNNVWRSFPARSINRLGAIAMAREAVAETENLTASRSGERPCLEAIEVSRLSLMAQDLLIYTSKRLASHRG